MVAGKSFVNGFEIEIAHGYDVAELREQWLLLQGGQSLPFFLTWSWVSCWLETYNPDLVVISAKLKSQTVAIGLFTCTTRVRHGVIKSKQYRLHQMGDPLLDQIWMEYNDFICLDKYRVSAVNACIQALQQSENNWDEIILSMVAASRAADIQYAINGSHLQLINPCFSKNLDAIQAENAMYLDTLNSNTRYQIRRSIRLYELFHGDIEYKFAKDIDEALMFFQEASKYHILRWEDSGFKNKQFIMFHNNLIKNATIGETVDLMKITSGDTTIAILYFHLVGRDVYFYLQGVNYEANKKLKPGLVAHSLAAQYYLDHGMRKYDFMGGYSQYKCQLSNRAQDLVTLCIQKPSLMFGFEKFCRKVKSLIDRAAGKEA